MIVPVTAAADVALVVDASILVEYVLDRSVGRWAEPQLRAHAGNLHLPHHAVIESSSVLRSLVMRGEIQEHRARGALRDVVDFPASRWPAEPLLPRVWSMRHNVTAYDGAYLALAEALAADLITADRRLAADAAGVCQVVVLAP